MCLWLGVLLLILAACAVREQDLIAWEGAPVSALETHPVFITIPVVRTVASDGTQIWNFVNGRNAAARSGGGAVFSGVVSFATYNTFTNCMQRLMACNNIFLIRDGRVVQYSPVGTGGAPCYTNENARPGAARRGANIL